MSRRSSTRHQGSFLGNLFDIAILNPLKNVLNNYVKILETRKKGEISEGISYLDILRLAGSQPQVGEARPACCHCEAATQLFWGRVNDDLSGCAGQVIVVVQCCAGIFRDLFLRIIMTAKAVLANESLGGRSSTRREWTWKITFALEKQDAAQFAIYINFPCCMPGMENMLQSTQKPLPLYQIYLWCLWGCLSMKKGSTNPSSLPKLPAFQNKLVGAQFEPPWP